MEGQDEVAEVVRLLILHQDKERFKLGVNDQRRLELVSNDGDSIYTTPDLESLPEELKRMARIDERTSRGSFRVQTSSGHEYNFLVNPDYFRLEIDIAKSGKQYRLTVRDKPILEET